MSNDFLEYPRREYLVSGVNADNPTTVFTTAERVYGFSYENNTAAPITLLIDGLHEDGLTSFRYLRKTLPANTADCFVFRFFAFGGLQLQLLEDEEITVTAWVSTPGTSGQLVEPA